MRDLVHEPDEIVRAERARIASEGWGARLLGLQAPDGQWGGGVYAPGWISTNFTLSLLRDLGLDPSSKAARMAISRVRDEITWGEEFGDHPFFEGEVEPCINGTDVHLGRRSSTEAKKHIPAPFPRPISSSSPPLAAPGS